MTRLRLMIDLRHAVKALEAARYALDVIEPHPRDYYLQGPGAYSSALDEHRARLDRVRDVTDELKAIYLAVEIE